MRGSLNHHTLGDPEDCSPSCELPTQQTFPADAADIAEQGKPTTGAQLEFLTTDHTEGVPTPGSVGQLVKQMENLNSHSRVECLPDL